MDASYIGKDANIALGRREVVQVQGPAGTTLRVTHGEVWITRHHDTEDHLLVAGEVLDHAGQGKTLVSAVKDARVEIRLPRREPRTRTALAQRLLRLASIGG